MAKTQNERAVIDLVINGQQAKTSLKEVSMAITKMRSELNKMREEDNPALYQKKVAEINKMIQAQREMSSRINDTTTAWGRFKKEMATVATGVLGGNAITFAVQTLISLIPQAIDKSMKLKDQLADIAKATDMTDEEVGQLNQTLKTFNTRTATKDLRDMAVVAGQFGIAKNEIADFVQSADKLNVALGDQFQGAEQTAGTMLTLRNTFQDIKSDKIDQDMMHIGNALNVLEADGAATATVMADFSSRIGGVAIPMGMTSGQVLGLSAALQEMNVTAERGGTAVVDILNGMAKAPESFAKYARSVDGGKLSTKQFTDLLNKDMYGALMAVVRGFKDGDTSATGMARKMSDMELSGNGVMEVFMKLASNTQLVEDKIKKAGDAITKTDSITGEFNKKNHELAVNMKVLGEWFSGFLSAGWLTQFGEGLAKIAVVILGLNRETGKLTSAYGQQREQVTGLDRQLKPLLDKHDQLKTKTKLSHTEQQELHRITQQIARIMPNAVTGFDDYGQAISVSTDKVRDLLAVQRQLLKSMNKGAIAEQQGELRNLLYQQKELAQLRKSGVRYVVTDARNGTVEDQRLTQAELIQLDSDIEKKKQQIAAKLKQIAELEGKVTEKPKVVLKPATPTGGGGNSEKEETEKEEKARLAKEKRDAAAAKRQQNTVQREEDSYESLIARARQRTAQIEDDSFEKDQLRFGENYSKLYEKAKGSKTRITEITQLMYNELSAIQQKHDDKEFKKAKKNSDKLLEQTLADAELKKANTVSSLAASVGGGSMTPEAAKLRDLEAEALLLDQKEILYRTHYEALKQLAGDNAENLNLIAIESAAKQGEIDKARTDNEADQALARGAVRKSELDHVNELAEKQKKMYEAERDFRQYLMGQLANAMLNDWSQTLTGYKEFWQGATIVQKAALLATKAYALAEIGINLARQISAINVMAAVMNGLVPLSGEAFRWKGIALASGMAAANTALVISSAATGSANVKAFADGGFSNPEGFVGRATMFAGSGGPFLAGEAGTEFIINNRALQQPVVANFARMLDSVQQSGNYASLAGGMANGASGGSAFGIGSDSKDYMDVMSNSTGLAIVRELQANRIAMEDYASRPIQNNYLLFEQFERNLQEMRQGNTL